jgi:hypothetical protein
MSGKIIGYVRVSTIEQNTSRQLEGIHLDKCFEDKASGKNTNRPALAKHGLLFSIFTAHNVFSCNIKKLCAKF